ncbi:MAG: 30S ribosomal protein S4 [Anaerolineaceae bacterium]|nr:30S ribosomal protein S4 [Anaerolineaceae bacterium]
MASYHGPKAKQQRRFGTLLVPRPKYSRILDSRAYPPGDHGKEKSFRGGRRSDYGLQLDEKQKLSFIYNVRERQLRNYYKKAVLMPGATGINLLGLLERRLDNLVYKAGLGATIWAARQLVVHGHVEVNGSRLDLPSYQVKPNDVISLSAKMKKNVHVVEWIEQIAAYPPYLSVDKDNVSATLLRTPEEGEIQVPVEIQLVVEYYNRLT